MAFEATPARAVARTRSRAEAGWFFGAVAVAAAVVAFAWTLHGTLARIYGLTGPAWDLAYDQQVIWNVSIGQGFYSSFARANFLGIHLEPIFVLPALVEKVWASPVVLLVFSSAGLAATAPAAYLFLRAILPAEHPTSRWLALSLAVPIPFWADIQEAARDFFHPENMALALAMLAAWAGIRGHRVAMWVLCVLVLACKEDQVYTVGVIALLMRSFGAPDVRRHWRFVLYLAGAWFLVGTGVVQQHFRDYGYTDFVYYRWLVGLDPTLPPTLANVLAALFRPQALVVVATVIASLAALPLLAPRWLLLVVPPYVASVLSEHSWEQVLLFHYVLLLLFPLVVAGAVGARRLLERRSLSPSLAVAAAVPALLLGLTLGRFPPALLASAWAYQQPDAVTELDHATAVIPSNAPVNADPALTVWLADRHQINDFPDMLDGSCYVVIDRRAYLSGPTLAAVRDAALAKLPSSGRRILYDDGRFVVWSPVQG